MKSLKRLLIFIFLLVIPFFMGPNIHNGYGLIINLGPTSLNLEKINFGYDESSDDLISIDSNLNNHDITINNILIDKEQSEIKGGISYLYKGTSRFKEFKLSEEDFLKLKSKSRIINNQSKISKKRNSNNQNNQVNDIDVFANIVFDEYEKTGNVTKEKIYKVIPEDYFFSESKGGFIGKHFGFYLYPFDFVSHLKKGYGILFKIDIDKPFYVRSDYNIELNINKFLGLYYERYAPFEREDIMIEASRNTLQLRDVSFSTMIQNVELPNDNEEDYFLENDFGDYIGECVLNFNGSLTDNFSFDDFRNQIGVNLSYWTLGEVLEKIAGRFGTAISILTESLIETAMENSEVTMDNSVNTHIFSYDFQDQCERYGGLIRALVVKPRINSDKGTIYFGREYSNYLNLIVKLTRAISNDRSYLMKGYVGIQCSIYHPDIMGTVDTLSQDLDIGYFQYRPVEYNIDNFGLHHEETIESNKSYRIIVFPKEFFGYYNLILNKPNLKILIESYKFIDRDKTKIFKEILFPETLIGTSEILLTLYIDEELTNQNNSVENKNFLLITITNMNTTAIDLEIDLNLEIDKTINKPKSSFSFEFNTNSSNLAQGYNFIMDLYPENFLYDFRYSVFKFDYYAYNTSKMLLQKNGDTSYLVEENVASKKTIDLLSLRPCILFCSILPFEENYVSGKIEFEIEKISISLEVNEITNPFS